MRKEVELKTLTLESLEVSEKREVVDHRIYAPNISVIFLTRPSHFSIGQTYPVYSYADDGSFYTENDLGEVVLVDDMHFVLPVNWTENTLYHGKKNYSFNEYETKGGANDKAASIDFEYIRSLNGNYKQKWLFEGGNYEDRKHVLMCAEIDFELWPEDLKNHFSKTENDIKKKMNDTRLIVEGTLKTRELD